MEYMLAKLKEREEQGNLRSLSLGKGRIDFFSNDYLGLARNKELSKKIAKEYSRFEGKINGSSGSRLLAGNNPYFEELEENLAKIFQCESALLFNSGYNANLSILSCVPQRGDTIILDELCHASLIDGARLSFANRFSFKHNDLEDLEKKLQNSNGSVFVAVESVYSMDGDIAPILELTKLCERYEAKLIVDEAHSTGTWGNGGNGMVNSLGLQDKVFARVMTFGKGMGVHGACICGTKVLKDYLINFARPFIYTTALPIHSLVSIDQSFKYLIKNEILQVQLKEKIDVFLNSARDTGLIEYLKPSESSIQVVNIPGNENVKKIASHLMDMRFDVRAILSPTVKMGEERLRICIHSFNKAGDIHQLVKSVRALL